MQTPSAFDPDFNTLDLNTVPSHKPYPPKLWKVASPWLELALLRDAGKPEEAILWYVAETDFVSPSEAELTGLYSQDEDCVIALDRNLRWAAVPRPLAEAILRMLAIGQLIVHAEGFMPSDAKVLQGAKARLLPHARLWGLAAARCQPAKGFRTPHRLQASLRVGPNANLAAIHQLIAQLKGESKN